MNTIPKHPRKNIALRARSFSKLAYLAVGMIFSSSLAVSQVPPTSVVRSTGVMANDYFHTGAGARYLRRAEGDIATQTARGNKAPRRTTPDYDTPVNATEPSYLTGGFQSSQFVPVPQQHQPLKPAMLSPRKLLNAQ
jgi:hypothetical protein